MGAHAVKDEPSKNVVPQFLELLTKNKYNRGIEFEPKMAIIGDYWDQKSIT
jgi:hypothetical protein